MPLNKNKECENMKRIAAILLLGMMMSVRAWAAATLWWLGDATMMPAATEPAENQVKA